MDCSVVRTESVVSWTTLSRARTTRTAVSPHPNPRPMARNRLRNPGERGATVASPRWLPAGTDASAMAPIATLDSDTAPGDSSRGSRGPVFSETSSAISGAEFSVACSSEACPTSPSRSGSSSVASGEAPRSEKSSSARGVASRISSESSNSKAGAACSDSVSGEASKAKSSMEPEASDESPGTGSPRSPLSSPPGSGPASDKSNASGD